MYLPRPFQFLLPLLFMASGAGQTHAADAYASGYTNTAASPNTTLVVLGDAAGAFSILTPPANGALSHPDDGSPVSGLINGSSVVFTPDEGFRGQDSFTFSRDSGSASTAYISIFDTYRANPRQVGETLIGAEGSSYGVSVATSNDGMTVAVGAPETLQEVGSVDYWEPGQVSVFRYDGESWQQLGQVLEGFVSCFTNVVSDTQCQGELAGHRVSLSGDGNVLAIGAPRYSVGADYPEGSGYPEYVGRVVVYDLVSGSWVQRGGALVGQRWDYAGDCVELSSDGTVLGICSAPGSNADDGPDAFVEFWKWNGNKWEQMGGRITLHEDTGEENLDLALSADGHTFVVGGGGSGYYAAYSTANIVTAYQWSGSAWVQMGTQQIDCCTQSLNKTDFGHSLAMSADGRSFVAGASNYPGGGITRVFKWDGSDWTKVILPISGALVAMSSNGLTVAASGSFSSGQSGVAVYQYHSGAWEWISTTGQIFRSNYGRVYGEQALALSDDGRFVVLGSSDDAEARIVELGNNRPSITSGIPGTALFVGDEYSYQVTATDPDADELSFDADNLPQWMDVDAASGAVSGVPALEDAGTYRDIFFRVSDGEQTDQSPAFDLVVMQDTDDDGVPNDCDDVCSAAGYQEDLDDDGDYVLDADDAYPLISLDGRTDTDIDGRPDDCDGACIDIGMTADDDDDNDGVFDPDDNYPLIALGDLTDTDGDGAPDQCGELAPSPCDGTEMASDLDDDNDLVADVEDAFPLDPAESLDTDGDGTGNNADTDDDDDGLSDAEEAELGLDPLHPDSDGDGATDFEEVNDVVAPMLSTSLDDSDYYSSAQILTIICSDAGTGCQSVTYSINGDQPSKIYAPEGKPEIASEGAYQILISATDYADNETLVDLGVKYVDYLEPSIEITRPQENQQNMPDSVRAIATDSGSGIQTVEFKIRNVTNETYLAISDGFEDWLTEAELGGVIPWVTYESVFIESNLYRLELEGRVDPENTYQVWGRAADKSGRISETEEFCFGDGCLVIDDDGDGVPNVQDNCPLLSNSNQLDTDSDLLGDVCDDDDDGDGVADYSDLCPLGNCEPRGLQIDRTDYEDGKIILYVSVGDDGGSSLIGYEATCTDGNNIFTGTSPSSPITVSGLTNDVAYTCRLTATNSVGTSSASAATEPITPEEILTGLPIWLLYQATQQSPCELLYCAGE